MKRLFKGEVYRLTSYGIKNFFKPFSPSCPRNSSEIKVTVNRNLQNEV
ncbi:MAG: hypothetical protein LBJ00_08275 [Planctomycetaceae bacterium]|nr:hypothetical protein [Planctomycetaceae bacterium]